MSSPPVANPDTAAVSEDGTLTVTGDVLSNDTDPAGLALSVVSVDGDSIANNTTIVGTFGTLVISSDGDYTYTLNNASPGVLGLAAGQLAQDAFSYVISDGQTYTQTTTETLQNLLTQSEAFNTWATFGTAPVVTANVAAGPNGGAATADQLVLSAASSGLYTNTNVSGQYTFSVWVLLVGGSGTFSLNYYAASTGTNTTQAFVATGTWQRVSLTFTGDGNANSNVALGLNVGQAAAGTFDFWGAQVNAGATPGAYAATTGSTVNTTTTVTAPVTVGSTLTVGVTGGPPTAVPDVAAVSVGGTLTATGNLLTNDTAPTGETLSVVSVDGTSIGNTTTIVGTYGTLVVSATGAYTYTLAASQANVQAIASGTVASDVFAYVISDGQTYTDTTTETLQNLLAQSEAFDTWATFGTAPAVTANVAAGPNGGAATADKVVLSSAGSGLYSNTPASGQSTFSVWVLLNSGSGTFSLNYYAASTGTNTAQAFVATGSWQRVSLTFTGDGNANSNVALGLNAGQTASGTFEFWGAQVNSGATPGTYVATTGSIVNTTTTVSGAQTIGATLTVDVTGDAAPLKAVPDTAAVVEDATLTATGNVLTNDTGPSLSVMSVNGTTVSGATTIVGTYGTLVIQPNGAYSYTLANSQGNVRALSNGQLVTDVFTYTISDGVTQPSSSSSTLTVSVTGSTPVAAPDTAAVAVQGALTAAGNLLGNDTATAAGPLSVATVNGIAVSGATTIVATYGTLVVQPNGSYKYTLNSSSAIVMALQPGQVASDNFAYTVSDGSVYDTSSTAVNDLTQSDAFNNAAWSRFGGVSVTSDVASGPSGGGATADQLVLPGANSGIYYTTNVSGTYTFSVWVKLVSGSGAFTFNYFWAAAGVSYAQTAVATSTWQRLSWTFNGEGNATDNIAIGLNTSQSATTLELSGAQLNPGSTPEAYVPTNGSAASATVDATGTIGSTLSVTVSGPSSSSSGPTLNLQTTTQGAVVSLATDQWTTPLTILPLGDSITAGWTQLDWTNQANLPLEPGYRGPLWQDFLSNGMLVNLIGPNNNGPATQLDTNDAGYPGYTTAQLLALLPGLLATQVPQAALLLGGTNDLLQGVPQATTIANLTSMINDIESASPTTYVYVGTLPYLSADSTTSLNAAITTMVSTAKAAGKHVVLVNNSNVTSAYIGPDGTHPTAAGYSLLAQNWYNAIIAAQPDKGGTPGGTATAISAATVNIVGGGGPEFLAGNAQANIITAGSGNDVLSGGGGNDTLIAGSGKDEFVISATSGNISILNFSASLGDFLDFNKISGLTSTTKLTPDVTQSGGNTVINLAPFGVGETVTIAGYTGSLTNSLFT